ncbi:MAG: hypothetical protein IKS87_04485, partial [Lachnospiraceae bacterium]|nr:hypothetical protein [Lachnospiraceae bacterium]
MTKIKKARVTALFLIFILPLFTFTSCGAKEGGPEAAEETKEDVIEIGMSFDSFVIERWQRERDVFTATARELGAQVNVQTANGEVEEQIAQIGFYLHKKGIDVVDWTADAAGPGESGGGTAVQSAWFDMMPAYSGGTIRPAL